jgi:hypothetical protein
MKELSDISTSWDVKNGGAVSRTCTDSLRADRVVCPHDLGALLSDLDRRRVRRV